VCAKKSLFFLNRYRMSSDKWVVYLWVNQPHDHDDLDCIEKWANTFNLRPLYSLKSMLYEGTGSMVKALMLFEEEHDKTYISGIGNVVASYPSSRDEYELMRTMWFKQSGWCRGTHVKITFDTNIRVEKD